MLYQSSIKDTLYPTLTHSPSLVSQPTRNSATAAAPKMLGATWMALNHHGLKVNTLNIVSIWIQYVGRIEL